MTFATDRASVAGSSSADQRGPGPAGPGSRWWRRRWILVALSVAAVVAAAVLVDLPTNSTHNSDVQTARGVIAEITGFLKACNYAVGTALRLYAKSVLPNLTGTQRSTLHSLATTDYAACSFTSQTIVTLATIRAPDSRTGRVLDKLVNDSLIWCDTDAMRVIGYVSDLIRSPSDSHLFGLFVQSERRLDAERRMIAVTVDGLARVLRSRLPQLRLVDAHVMRALSGRS